MEKQRFESYPWWIVVVSVAAPVVTYSLGALILSGFGVLVSAVYLGYCVFVESSVLRGSCRHCYYYGRLCAFGRGRLCSALFRPGDPQRFLRRDPSLRDILPDVLVPAVPIIAGTVLLVGDFDWVLLAAILAVVLLATVGTGMIRGRLACRHCAQRELGCPAEQLFNRRREGSDNDDQTDNAARRR